MDAPTVISDPTWLAVIVGLVVVVTVCGVLLAASLGWMLGVRHQTKQLRVRRIGMPKRSRAIGSFAVAAVGLVLSVTLWQWNPAEPIVATAVMFATVAGVSATYIFVLAMVDEIRRLRTLQSGVQKRLKYRRY